MRKKFDRNVASAGGHFRPFVFNPVRRVRAARLVIAAVRESRKINNRLANRLLQSFGKHRINISLIVNRVINQARFGVRGSVCVNRPQRFAFGFVGDKSGAFMKMLVHQRRKFFQFSVRRFDDRDAVFDRLHGQIQCSARRPFVVDNGLQFVSVNRNPKLVQIGAGGGSIEC